MKQYLDFEVDRGTKVIKLLDIRQILQYYPFAHKYRICLLLLALSLRPREPQELTWHNFDNGLIIFRPHKQHGKVLRKIKVPPKIWAEFMDYKARNFFPEPGRLFDFSSESFRRLFNQLRPNLNENWNTLSGNYRNGRIAQFYMYSLHSFRTTAATLAYHFFSRVYGQGDMALTQTCAYMGHSEKKMTAHYYIKRVDDLGLEFLPNMSYLQLLDYLVYGETQEKITQYCSERQAKAIEY